MDKRDWYYKQLVSQADMDEAFDWVESSIWELAIDNTMNGIHDGLDAVQNTVPDLNILISGGSATGKDGERIYTSTSSTLLDCSVDEYGVSTAVVGGANSRVLSVFARFVRDATDPEVDGNGLTVYTHQLEDMEFFVRQGTEAVAPTAPALLADALLVADISLAFGQTTIQTVHFDVTRREDWFRYVGTTYSLVAGTPHEAFEQTAADGLVEAFDKHVSDTAYPHGGGSVSYSFTQRWYGAVAVAGPTPPPATVAAAFDAVVYDLAQTTPAADGAVKIGIETYTTGGSYVTWGSVSINAAMKAIADAIDNHIAGAAPMHPASSIVFTPVSWISSTDVQSVIAEICTDLASTASGTSGAARIGTPSIAGSPESWGSGTLTAVLTAIYGHLNDRTERAANETISGDWIFTGLIDATDKIRFTGDYQQVKTIMGGAIAPDVSLDDIIKRRTWGTRGSWGHMWSPANTHTCAAPPMDVCCARDDKDVHLLAMVPSSATVEIVDVKDITTTDVADVSVAGAPLPTAMCSDARDVFIMYDNDTVYAWRFNPTPGGGAWTPTWGPIALPAGASGSYDRILVASDTYIMTANSGLAISTTNSYTRMRISDGGGVLSGTGSASSAATRYPRGGMCSVGTTVYASDYDPAGGQVAEIDPLTMGSPGHFAGANLSAPGSDIRDITTDGEFIWMADFGQTPGAIHAYPKEQARSTAKYIIYQWNGSHLAGKIISDGFNVWASDHTTAASPNGVELNCLPVGEYDWGAGIIAPRLKVQATPPWVNVITPNPGKMVFDGDSVWIIRDEGTNWISRVPHAANRN